MTDFGFQIRYGCVDQIFTLKQTGENAREKKRRVYEGYMDVENAYGRVNREDIWHVLRMYDGGGKLLNIMKSVYAKSLTCIVRVDNGGRHG